MNALRAAAMASALAMIPVGCSGKGARAPRDAGRAPSKIAAPPSYPGHDPATPIANTVGSVASGEGVKLGARWGASREPVAGEEGDTLDVGSVVEATAGHSARIRFRDGASVRLTGVAEIGSEAPAQLLLLEGEVEATLPPASGSERPPLRIVTPAATIGIGGSGRVLTRVAGERLVLAITHGVARAWTGEANPLAGQDEPGWRPLEAGQLVVGMTTSIYDNRPLSALAGETRPARVSYETTRNRVEELLVEHDRIRAHMRELDANHRAARGNPPRASALMRDIVLAAQSLGRTREQLLLRWERLLVLARLPSAQAASLAAEPALRARVRTALGLPEVVSAVP